MRNSIQFYKMAVVCNSHLEKAKSMVLKMMYVHNYVGIKNMLDLLKIMRQLTQCYHENNCIIINTKTV